MKCEACGEKSVVKICRTMSNGNIYRRRRCIKCGNTWTTIEIRKEDITLVYATIVTAAKGLRDNFKGA